MSKDTSFKFVTDYQEYKKAKKNGESLVYTAALHMPQTIKPLCEKLNTLTSKIESTNVLNPIATYYTLLTTRKEKANLSVEFKESYKECITKLSEPVEGAEPLDSGWVQGFTSANGTAALYEITTAFSGLNETIDRKFAYTMACFSLYIAIISLTATAIFGWLSL